MNKFEQVSGLKINVQKTELINLDNSNAQQCPKLKLNWVITDSKVLGVKISRDMVLMLEINVELIIGKVKTIIGNWGKRKLTLMGKINIIKTLIIPQLLYLFNNLPTPNKKHTACH